MVIIVCALFSSQLFAKPVTVEQVRKVTGTFLKAQNIRQARQANVFSVEATTKVPSKKLTIGDIKEIRGDDGKILAYVTELEPEGFIITAVDTDIRPVLGYSFKGKFPFEDSKQNILLHLVRWDVDARLEALQSEIPAVKNLTQSNNLLWIEYTLQESTVLERLSSTTQWGPLISTHWYQSGHYNNKCPYVIPYVPGLRRPVGCVATAMAQIVNYWAYPGSISFSSDWWPDGDRYTSEGGIDIDGDSSKYGFPTFSELNSALDTINYNGNEDEEAYLCFAAGIKVCMNYGILGSGADTSYTAVALTNEFSYGSAERDYRSNVWNRKQNNVIQNIKEGWPVQIAIYESGKKSGHSIIVDGYRDTDDYFHVNMGWGGASDGWYNFPNISSYDVISKVVFNICPYQGWNQWGADERNSFGTVYVAPTTDPPKDKWQVTCPSTHSFSSGLVVGTSNKIYAACSPRGTSDHPFVYVINQYGELQKTIEINENVKIEFISQTNNGDVFISTENGGVYRINPRTDAATKIFTEPYGDDIYSLKVDPDGYMYACTFYNLYRLNRYGTVQWTFSAPADTMFLSGGKNAAIDTDRNRVYVVYYHTTTKVPYLAQIERLAGTSVATRSFGSIPVPIIRTPIVGPEGTVYIGIYNTYYALYHNSITGTPKWTKSLNMRNGALSHDGQMFYAPYWEQIGGTWYNKLGAFDAIDGTEKWAIPFQQNPDTDDIWQPYVAGNGVICFTVERGGSPYTVYAYRDTGSNYEYLWEYDAGSSGGDFAFGPGATLYFWGLTGLADTIYAVSEGAVGDPDGGGMGFTDNAAPLMPSNPTPEDEANDICSVVTLSWTCSDPEAHTLKYSLFVGESGYDMVPVATDINDTSYTLSGLKPAAGYAWKIIATDGQAPTEGPTWAFATKLPNPDLSGDGIVNFKDFAILGRHLMNKGCNEPNWCEGADFNWSGIVDFQDVNTLVDYWLWHASEHILSVTAVNGSVIKTPDKTSYNHAEEVTLQAIPDTGYHFENWSGDLSGNSNPETIVMDAHKSVTANFTINTYTLNVTAVNGSVIKTPDKTSYNHGEEVTLQAIPDTGYHFENWSGDLSGNSNPETIVMDAHKSVTANFTPDELDVTAPTVTDCSPPADSIQVPLNTLIMLHVVDTGTGVDANSVTIRINNNIVYTGNTAQYSSIYGECYRIGTKADYTYTYQSNEMFDFDQLINVTVNATDLAGNVMDEHSYSFTTETQ